MACAVSIARVASSWVPNWNFPTTSDGRAGLSESKVAPPLTRSPPITIGWVRPNCFRTVARACSKAAWCSGLEKSMYEVGRYSGSDVRSTGAIRAVVGFMSEPPDGRTERHARW